MRLIDFIVCDDVRHEAGGKVTLVGVYADGIKIEGKVVSWPAQLPKLGVFAKVMLDADDQIPESFSLTFKHNGERISSFDGPLATIRNRAKPIAIAVLAAGFVLPGPGGLSAELIFRKGENVLGTLAPAYVLEIS